MIDTHTHLYMDDFAGEETAAVDRAVKAGVTLMLFPGVNLTSVDPMRRLHAERPDSTLLALGLHPSDVDEHWEAVLDKMEAMLDSGEWSGIGETGIDLYHDATFRKEQKEAFARQLRWAADRDLPLIIHCRDGLEDCIEVIEAHEGKLPRMVFHSFTGTVADVRRIRRVCDPWFGINGVVTFKNAPLLREALPEIGLDRILLETDSPYLAPVPNRGKRNESAYLPAIARCIASVLGVGEEDIEKTTDENARQFLGLP